MAPTDVDELRTRLDELEQWQAELCGVDGRHGAFASHKERCADSGRRLHEEVQELKREVAVLKTTRVQALLLAGIVTMALPYVMKFLGAE
jgi:hypothetical protein